MAFSLPGYSVLLLSLLLVVSGENHKSEFAKKVQNKLSTGAFKKLFNTDHKDIAQFVRGLKKAEKAAADIAGASFPSSLDDVLAAFVKKYADQCTPDSLFRVYINAEGETLQALGVLNDDNMDEMAEGLAKYLMNAVPSVKKENIEYTAPAISTALFKLLKAQGFASGDVLRLFTKKILKNIKAEYPDGL